MYVVAARLREMNYWHVSVTSAPLHFLHYPDQQVHGNTRESEETGFVRIYEAKRKKLVIHSEIIIIIARRLRLRFETDVCLYRSGAHFYVGVNQQIGSMLSCIDRWSCKMRKYNQACKVPFRLKLLRVCAVCLKLCCSRTHAFICLPTCTATFELMLWTLENL